MTMFFGTVIVPKINLFLTMAAFSINVSNGARRLTHSISMTFDENYAESLIKIGENQARTELMHKRRHEGLGGEGEPLKKGRSFENVKLYIRIILRRMDHSMVARRTPQ